MDANPRIVGDSAARLGESDPATGIGLGLAVSRGMTEATRGTLEPEQTPGGGLTMTMSLPAAVSTWHVDHRAGATHETPHHRAA